MKSQITLASRLQRFNKRRHLTRNADLYLMLLPVALFYIIFIYTPMYGVQIAFKDFQVAQGIIGSPWAGLKHFEKFFSSYYFSRLIGNTLGISLLQLLAGFPFPILLALLINELPDGGFKKTVQNVTYAPHFLSIIVVVGMLQNFLNTETGLVNHMLAVLGQERIAFMTEPGWFRPLYVLSGIWQNAGWSSIIYIAALSGIDMQLHEAARVDGANRLQRIWHINLPGIIPTIVILFIMNVGNLMSVGFEKAFLMQNDLNLAASDVISTYSYRMGIQGAQFSFASAVGLFNSAINFILLIAVNRLSKCLTETSLW